MTTLLLDATEVLPPFRFLHDEVFSSSILPP